MMEESRRVRLIFKDKEAILSKSQKSEGFKRCWLLLKPHHKTIADFTAYILQAFQLHQCCPHGLILCVDDFVLPPFESTSILKDKDIISVRKKQLALSLDGDNEINVVEELHILDKQPINNGALLLANEEFEQETGGYQSDEPEDELEEEDEEEKSVDESEAEDDEERLECSLHLEKASGVEATSKKRKAPEKLQESKKKKQKIQESIQNDVSGKQAENAQQDFDHAKKVTLHEQTDLSNLKKRKDGSSDKKTVKLNDKDMNPSPSETDTDQMKKDEDKSLEASERTRKGPSRSARRKKIKRQWIREMAKIQKQAEATPPKGLENWRKKSASARNERKKHNNWKQKPFKAYSEEDPSEPKGLLHWKSWSGNDKSDDKGKDVETQNATTSEQPNQKNNMEDEVVPVVIRPGHIRFEPREGDQAARENQVSGESFQWNGTTSKRKGQKWGTEKSTERNDNKVVNGVHSNISSSLKEIKLDHPIDFDKLPSLSCLPKEGDVLGYRLLELSSSWTPELSSFRVGHVSWCNPKSRKLLLTPVAGFPISFGKSDEDGSDLQPDTSPYKEDGSLEIDFATLADVRVVKDADGGPRDTEGGGSTNGGLTPMANAALCGTPVSKDKQIQASVPGNGEVTHVNQKNAAGKENGDDLWEQLNEALSAKKAELSQESSWGKPKPVSSTWSYRALKGSAMGPTMALLRSKNKLRNR